MKTISRTESKFFIKSIMSLEDASNLFYDDSPSVEDFRPDTRNSVWFALYEDKEVAGLITLEYLNYILWVPHIFIFKKFRQNGSEEWGKQVADYMKKNCGVKKFLVFTPYISAKKYAEKVGFKNLTTLTSSIKKNGELLDQYLLELE